ncbi:MAG: hypothetical protein AB8G22_20080 [Saprospiraceae bacterium]
MKILEIPADYGFIGIVNCDTFNGMVDQNHDAEMMHKMFVEQINLHHLLLWSTGATGSCKVKFTDQASDSEVFREFNGVIEITNNKLYLINYMELTMAATNEKFRLPSPWPYFQKLFIELENGKYLVKIRQMIDLQVLHPDPEHEEPFHFEIIPMKITRNPSLYKNKVDQIYLFK